MKRVLRILEGPMRGAVFVLARRTTIGRAADCDIQLVHDGVSRRHARVIACDDGIELVDLQSDNGTFVGDRRVQRWNLASGDVIRVLSTHFRYEELPVTAQVRTSMEFSLRQTTPDSLRTTASVPVVGAYEAVGTGARTPPPSDGAASSALDDAIPYAPGYEPPPGYVGRASMHDSPAVPTRRREPRPHRRAVVSVGEYDVARVSRDSALAREGVTLIEDVLTYRDLRAQERRGLLVADSDRVRYVELEAQLERDVLGSTGSTTMRRFHRFAVQVPATIANAEDGLQQASVSVRDIGAGGARLIVGPGWRPGDVVLLVFDLPRQRVEIRSRVVWTDDEAGHVGVAFASTTA